jgi:hypothetical protein
MTFSELALNVRAGHACRGSMDHLELQAEVIARQCRLKFLQAIIRLAFLLVRLSGFRRLFPAYPRMNMCGGTGPW